MGAEVSKEACRSRLLDQTKLAAMGNICSAEETRTEATVLGCEQLVTRRQLPQVIAIDKVRWRFLQLAEFVC